MRIPYWKNIIGLNFLQTSFSSTRIFWLFLSKNNANFKRIYGSSLSFSFRVSFSSFCYFIIIFFFQIISELKETISKQRQYIEELEKRLKNENRLCSKCKELSIPATWRSIIFEQSSGLLSIGVARTEIVIPKLMNIWKRYFCIDYSRDLK